MKYPAEMNIGMSFLQEKVLRSIGVVSGFRRLLTENHSDNRVSYYLLSIFRLLPAIVNQFSG
jgi:hypothetical protein